MHAAAEFSGACKYAGIKPIFGYEAYCAPRSRLDKEPIDAKWSQLVLLAKNEEGLSQHSSHCDGSRTFRNVPCSAD